VIPPVKRTEDAIAGAEDHKCARNVTALFLHFMSHLFT